jgi:hypothetical protein
VVAGLLWWYVVNDLVAALCCRVRLKIDFQQANGRNVDVDAAVAIVVVLGRVDVDVDG